MLTTYFKFIGFSTSSSEGTGPILMDNVGCFGWEARLIDCSHSRDTSEDTHDGDVAVQCLPGELSYCTHVTTVTSYPNLAAQSVLTTQISLTAQNHLCI